MATSIEEYKHFYPDLHDPALAESIYRFCELDAIREWCETVSLFEDLSDAQFVAKYEYERFRHWLFFGNI